ncbi:MAG: putative ATPase [Chthonomonadales bacterium]|nr:putative ATPase [Chthonomonadales bacterium]
MEPDALPLWRITLFGGLTVKTNGPVVDRFEHRKAASLLGCLALSPHRSHSRDELMEMLWPEEDPEATRVRFRQVLLNLRRALDTTGAPSDTILVSDRTFIRLNPDVVSTDVAEFEAALMTAARQEAASVRVATLQRAVRLVTGPLLPGFYEDWAENERRRLTESYLMALSHLATALAKTGDINGALETARKALATDPLREEAHCDLMRLFAEAGQTTESLRQYQELEQRLWKELRIVPSPATKQLMEEIRSMAPIVTSRPADAPTATPVRAQAQTIPTQSEAPGSEPVRQSESSGSSLPASLTPLFGREAEIAWLSERLRPRSEGESRATRLVTLTGLGGSGKTRLALEIARLLQPLYGGALWFVPVVEVTEADQLMSAIAEAVCGPGVGRDALLDRLRRRPTLVVVDNFEQIGPGGATTIRSLLEQAPDLTCVVTSRQPLHIEGEVEFPVSRLRTPTQADSAETLLSCPSVQLFIDRAQHALPSFRLTEANREAMATLCEHLEGIPLALELAAAWCAVLSPSQILERYTQDFAILMSNRPDIPLRHQSLRVVIESSVQALEPALRELFVKLSVFQGGWTLAAAEEVCDDREALSNLAALKRCSLIVAEEKDGEMRFRMLETLRTFARNQLDAEAMEMLRNRHAEFFTALAERAASHMYGPDQIEWLARLQADYENLRAALDWTAQGEANREHALRLGIALTRFWNVRRFHKEATTWIAQAPLRSEGATPLLQARALEMAGFLTSNIEGPGRSRAMLQRSIDLYREMGDALGRARCLCTLAAVERDNGKFATARSMVEEALPVLQASSDLYQVARALGCLGMIEQLEHHDAEAEALLERSVTMYRICGHKKGTAWSLCTLASVVQTRSRTAARARFEEGLLLARALADDELIIHALYNLASLAEIEGDLPQAMQRLQEASETAKLTGISALEAMLTAWQGDLALELGDDAAARLFYAQTIQSTRRTEVPECLVGSVRCVARYQVEQGNPIPALHLLAAVDPHKALYLDTPVVHRERTHLDPAMLRERVGEATFAAEWALGEAMSLPQALDYAESLLRNPTE